MAGSKAQLDRLQRELDGEVDVESTWSSYVDDTLDLSTNPAPGVSHVDHFLRYLVEQGAITQDKYIELNARPDVSVSFDAPLEELLGSKRYERLHSLAQGGMGEIWIARDVRLRRNVAFKVLRLESAQNPAMVEQFLHEAQVTARLDHPSVVPVYSIEAEGETVAFAMKLIQGETLKELIEAARRHVLDDPRATAPEYLGEDHRLDIFVRICEAVAYAHSRDVLHRDLKPANIMVGEFGQVYVMDWGIADSLNGIDADVEEPEESLSEDPNVPRAGTPLYMSPEQARGDSLGKPSDIFTLGLILFELVSLDYGRTADSGAEALAEAIHGGTRPIRHVSPHRVVMPPLRAIVEKATATAPAERYASVDELGEDVRRYLRGEKVAAFKENPVQRTARWMTANKQKTLLALLLFIASSATATIWALYAEQTTAERARQQEDKLQDRAERREEQLADLLQRINGTTSSLDHEISNIEGLTRALSAAVKTTLEAPVRSTGAPLYFEEDFPERAPPDLGPSDRYQTDTSVAWPLFNVAPDVSRESVLQLAHQMNRLRAFLPQLLLESAVEGQAIDDSATLLRHEGVPLVYAAVGLEAGLYVVFPALPGAVPEEYDARKRPWYRVAENKGGLHWGRPYIDAAGNRLLLPSSRAVFGNGGEFLGVVSLSVEVDTLLARLEPAALNDGVEAFLIDSRGLVIGKSSGRDRVYASGMHGNRAQELKEFPWPDAVETIKDKRSGFIELQGGSLTALFGSLQAVDWYFVVVGPDAMLIGEMR